MYLKLGLQMIFLIVMLKEMKNNEALSSNESEIEERIVDCLYILSLKAGVTVSDNIMKLIFQNGESFLLLLTK